MSRIISKKHLKDFWENNRDAEKPLKHMAAYYRAFLLELSRRDNTSYSEFKSYQGQ